MRAFEYRHIIGFEETNLVGNVYFVNLLRWQGRCRELFLREHAPGLLCDLAGGCCLVTTCCSCDYLAELFAFDEIVVRMRLRALSRGRVTMAFEYWRQAVGGEELVARGEQKIACMRREGGHAVPVPLPDELWEVIRQFTGGVSLF
jgi:enediyne biosynthesis thioesterase